MTTPPEKPSYLKLAFANPYNLSLVIGGIAASVLTANPIPAIIALGGEGLWLLHAPESRFLRKTVWDPKLEEMQRERDAKQREAAILSLPTSDQSRVRRLLTNSRRLTLSPRRTRRSPPTSSAAN